MFLSQTGLYLVYMFCGCSLITFIVGLRWLSTLLASIVLGYYIYASNKIYAYGTYLQFAINRLPDSEVSDFGLSGRFYPMDRYISGYDHTIGTLCILFTGLLAYIFVLGFTAQPLIELQPVTLKELRSIVAECNRIAKHFHVVAQAHYTDSVEFILSKSSSLGMFTRRGKERVGTPPPQLDSIECSANSAGNLPLTTPVEHKQLTMYSLQEKKVIIRHLHLRGVLGAYERDLILSTLVFIEEQRIQQNIPPAQPLPDTKHKRYQVNINKQFSYSWNDRMTILSTLCSDNVFTKEEFRMIVEALRAFSLGKRQRN
jgi:hypothetical protein